jgi:hypothetical protein
MRPKLSMFVSAAFHTYVYPCRLSPLRVTQRNFTFDRDGSVFNDSQLGVQVWQGLNRSVSLRGLTSPSGLSRHACSRRLGGR